MTDARTAARTERRYEPTSSAPPGLFLLVLNAGALAAGAGAVSFFLRETNAELGALAAPVLGSGAALLGLAAALSASRGARVRVGPAGVAFEKGDLVRVPWHGVESLRVEGGALVVRGTSGFGVPVTETCTLHAHRDAVAAILHEARARVPGVIVGEIPAGLEVRAGAGEALALEPLQIAGRRCAASGKPIAFEADGTACARCERVYLTAAKPSACACGAAL
jgi:hypothetical protein